MENVQTVDLTNCDREPIHQLGCVQPIGFLLSISADWIITHASENAAKFLQRGLNEMLGGSLRDIISAEALHAIRNLVALLRGKDAVERAFGIRLQDDGPLFDVAVHMVGTKVIIECEASEPHGDINNLSLVRLMLGRLQLTENFAQFTREAARQVRSLTGLDRVMIYRFHADGSGEVIAESLRAGVDSFLGLRYPASDIPVQARALYERNWLRLISDVAAVPISIRPQIDPEGQPLDLSMSVLRAVSPIHLEYLRNMGVAASMSISILRGGKLWGLFACHHMVPVRVGFERRTAAELFAHMFSLLLDSRQRDEEVAYEASSNRLHSQLMASMVAGGSAHDIVSKLSETVGDLVASDGVGLWVEEKATLKGATPNRDEFLELVRFLNRTAASQVYCTSEIGKVHAPGKDFVERAAGLLAIPISRVPRDYLVFFRREIARTVAWAGNPNKPVELGPNGARLTPRKSFDAWNEVVYGQSAAWTEGELRAAGALRVTLLEVILALTDATDRERKTFAETQELLIAELNHRVRNILGLIRGLVSQSTVGATDIASFVEVLGGRVQALARAHDQLTADNWEPGSLATLVTTEAAAYRSTKANRIEAIGPLVLLKPPAFSTIALVIHELITNSVKYGALTDGGQVTIKWWIDEVGRLVIDWLEAGGPPVQAPLRRGFGSTIIERSIPFELGGEAMIEYLISGVHARHVIPAEYVVAPVEQTQVSARTAAAKFGGRLSGNVLLVEDSMIIALDAEEMLLGLGAAKVDTASSSQEAFRILDLYTPTFAMLDVNLGRETSFLIASRLRALGVPHIFATGYGDSISVPAEHSDTPIVNKPYTADSIARAVPTI